MSLYGFGPATSTAYVGRVLSETLADGLVIDKTNKGWGPTRWDPVSFQIPTLGTPYKYIFSVQRSVGQLHETLRDKPRDKLCEKLCEKLPMAS